MLDAAFRHLLLDLKGRAGKFIRVVVDITYPPRSCILVPRRELVSTQNASGHRSCICVCPRTLLQAVVFKSITWLLDRQMLSHRCLIECRDLN